MAGKTTTYKLIDGVEFYGKEQVDQMIADTLPGNIVNRIQDEEQARADGDAALGARIDDTDTRLLAESGARQAADNALAGQISALEQWYTSLVSANFTDTDGNGITVDDSNKSIRQIAHDELYRQIIGDAANVKVQLDTLKELADYLQNNPSIITDMYEKLGVRWTVDDPTNYGTFDFSNVLVATNIDDAIVELADRLTTISTELNAKIGDLTALNTVEKSSIVAAINSEFEWRRKNDEQLGLRIDTVEAGLAAEVANRAAADTAIDTKVGDLTQLTTTATDLVSAINNEKAARVAGDTDLEQSIAEIRDLVSGTVYIDLTAMNGLPYQATYDASELYQAITANNQPRIVALLGDAGYADVAYFVSVNKVNASTTVAGSLYTLADTHRAYYQDVKLSIAISHATPATAQLSVTQMLIDYATPIITLANKVGEPTALTTTDKTSLVAAINEVNAKAGTGSGVGVDKVGDLNALTTADNSSVVAAINELKAGEAQLVPIQLSNVTTFPHTQNIDLSQLASCINNSKPYTLDIEVQPIGRRFKNCPFTVAYSTGRVSFQVQCDTTVTGNTITDIHCTFTVDLNAPTATVVTLYQDATTVTGGNTATTASVPNVTLDLGTATSWPHTATVDFTQFVQYIDAGTPPNMHIKLNANGDTEYNDISYAIQKAGTAYTLTAHVTSENNGTSIDTLRGSAVINSTSPTNTTFVISRTTTIVSQTNAIGDLSQLPYGSDVVTAINGVHGQLHGAYNSVVSYNVMSASRDVDAYGTVTYSCTPFGNSGPATELGYLVRAHNNGEPIALAVRSGTQQCCHGTLTYAAYDYDQGTDSCSNVALSFVVNGKIFADDDCTMWEVSWNDINPGTPYIRPINAVPNTPPPDIVLDFTSMDMATAATFPQTVTVPKQPILFTMKARTRIHVSVGQYPTDYILHDCQYAWNGMMTGGAYATIICFIHDGYVYTASGTLESQPTTDFTFTVNRAQL